MSEFKVEKNIPIPAATRRAKYPFEQMSSGDSFLIQANGDKAIASARSSVYNAASTRKLKIVTRRDKNGLRVWLKD